MSRKSRAKAVPGLLCEEYDVAVTRALSEMKVLAELCLPLVRMRGLGGAEKRKAFGTRVSRNTW